MWWPSLLCMHSSPEPFVDPDSVQRASVDEAFQTRQSATNRLETCGLSTITISCKLLRCLASHIYGSMKMVKIVDEPCLAFLLCWTPKSLTWSNKFKKSLACKVIKEFALIQCVKIKEPKVICTVQVSAVLKMHKSVSNKPTWQLQISTYLTSLPPSYCCSSLTQWPSTLPSQKRYKNDFRYVFIPGTDDPVLYSSQDVCQNSLLLASMLVLSFCVSCLGPCQTSTLAGHWSVSWNSVHMLFLTPELGATVSQ